MGAEGDKLLILLRDRPVVAWSITALEESGVIDSIVVVASERNLEPLAAIIERVDCALPVEMVLGGARRQDSVGRAVEYLERGAPDMVVVHDGARPLVAPALVRAVLEAAREHGGATAGLPLKNACKEVDGRGFVKRSLDRSSLVSVQTPQAFAYQLLARAHREGRDQGAVADDDAELVERLGEPVKVVEGDYRNLKITTPDDLAAAAAHLAN
jgi:2-C-methyl-D-erythritol 4-phosphate cytidylyltransferase